MLECTRWVLTSVAQGVLVGGGGQKGEGSKHGTSGVVQGGGASQGGTTAAGCEVSPRGVGALLQLVSLVQEMEQGDPSHMGEEEGVLCIPGMVSLLVELGSGGHTRALTAWQALHGGGGGAGCEVCGWLLIMYVLFCNYMYEHVLYLIQIHVHIYIHIYIQMHTQCTNKYIQTCAPHTPTHRTHSPPL